MLLIRKDNRSDINENKIGDEDLTIPEADGRDFPFILGDAMKGVADIQKDS